MSQPITDKMLHLAEEWDAQEDARAIFLHCYCRMTRNMLIAIEGQRFHDNEWVSRLLHRFAEYYFEALTCYDCGDPVPIIWQYPHQRAREGRLHTLQHLLLGVNAHINYDLVLTLHEILAPEWPRLSASAKKERYEDHCLVNTIIAESIDEVQDEVIEKYSPGMDWVDKLMGRLDEQLIAALIRRWRNRVWERALDLCTCASAQKEKSLHQELEEEVMETARWIERVGWA